MGALSLPTVAETISTTEVLDADGPKPDTEIRHTRYPNVPLLGTGSTVLALGYIPALVGAAVSDRAGDDNMYIPVAGPFMSMARGADETRGQKTMLAIDGAVQSLGALAILGSFIIPEERTRRWSLFGRESRVGIAPRVAFHSVGSARTEASESPKGALGAHYRTLI